MERFALSLSCLIAASAAFAGVLNGNFDEARDGVPVGWRPSAKDAGNWLPTGGRDGRGAIRVAGDGKTDGRWMSEKIELEPDRCYAISFWTLGNGSGCVVSGPAEVNVDWGSSGTNWTRRLNVFRTQRRAKPYFTTLHFGQWRMAGEVCFDDVEVTPVKPVYQEADGLALGHGEQVCGRDYSFSSLFGGVSRNHARPLVGTTAGFNSDRWCLFRGAAVTYRFALPDRTWTSAKTSVTTVYHAGGSADLEVSADGEAWTRLATFTNCTTAECAIPAALLPAKALFVRVRGGEGCNLQVGSLSFDARFDGKPANVNGRTRFVSESDGQEVCATPYSKYFRTDYGEVLPGGGEALSLWRASSGWKIPPMRALPTATAGKLCVKTAANEAEAVQLVLRPKRDLAAVRVTAGELRDGRGHAIAASAVDVLRVGYVNVAMATDGEGCRGPWPDPLPPQDAAGATLPADENQPYWIRVKPPKGTPAGTYRGEVRVAYRDGAAAVPLEVEVFGFELPDEMTCETSFGFSAGTVSRYHGLKTVGQRKDVAAKYLRSLADHHISPYNPTPYVQWGVKWVGGSKDDPGAAEPVFDWSAWDKAMEEAFAKFHFNTFVIHVDGLGGGTYESRREPSIRGIPATDPAYDVLMGKYLKGIESHLREKGWLGKAYVYWFDEPDAKDYEFVMRGFDTLKRHAPGIRRMLTEEAVDGLIGGPNVWVPLTPNLHVPGEAKARSLGDTFWWYVCCGPKAPYVTEFTDHPGTELRLWLWQTWGENVTGILIWETTWWTSSNAYPDREHPQNPYEDAMCWCQGASIGAGAKRPWGNGDGRFLYPPRAAATPSKTPVLDGPVDSFRLEMLRDGIEDYEYFALLKRRLAAAKGLSAAERAGYEALLKVPADVYSSLTEFAADPATMERHREKLARAIERLSAN